MPGRCAIWSAEVVVRSHTGSVRADSFAVAASGSPLPDDVVFLAVDRDVVVDIVCLRGYAGEDSTVQNAEEGFGCWRDRYGSRKEFARFDWAVVELFVCVAALDNRGTF